MFSCDRAREGSIRLHSGVEHYMIMRASTEVFEMRLSFTINIQMLTYSFIVSYGRYLLSNLIHADYVRSALLEWQPVNGPKILHNIILTLVAWIIAFYSS